MELLASIGVFGWIILLLAVVGLVTLPQALREMWKRPWRKDPYGRPQPNDDGPAD